MEPEVSGEAETVSLGASSAKVAERTPYADRGARGGEGEGWAALAATSPWGVYSVWRRHALVYVRTWHINALPPTLEPLLYLLGFGYGLGPQIGSLIYQGVPVDYRHFIAPAMVAVGVLFQAFFEAAYGSCIRLQIQKTWNALLTGPLSYTDIFLGEWLWAATRGAIAGVVTAIVTVALGFATATSMLISMPLVLLGALMFSAVGLAVAGSVRSIDQINIPIFLFVLPMFTLSGAFFPRQNLPHWAAMMAGWLPLAPLIDLMRWPLAGLPPYWGVCLFEVIVWAVVFFLVAWKQIRKHVFR